MRPDRPGSTEWRWVAAILLLGLALRAGFVLTEQRGFAFEDSIDYDRAARTLLETGHFDARYYRFPLYPLLMAGSYRMFGTDPTPFRLIQAIFGTATCLAVWVLGRRLFGARAGLLALCGIAAFPLHVVLPGIEYPVLFGTFLIWCVMALLGGEAATEGPSRVRLILAGTGIAVASMLFEGGWVLGLFVCGWVGLAHRPRGARLRSLAVLGSTSILVLAPWFLVMVRSGDYRALVLRPGLHLPSAPGIDPPLWEGSCKNLLTTKVTGLAEHP